MSCIFFNNQTLNRSFSDVLSPEITCPDPSSYPNEPGKNYVTIDLPQANATDIVAVVSLTARPKSPLKLVVGSPVEVTYTAVDSTGNNASCSTMLRAIGNRLRSLFSSMWVMVSMIIIIIIIIISNIYTG